MPRESITSIDILKFIDGEFRTAARDVLDLHSLEIAEREEKFRCLPVVHRGNNVFSFTKNSSKFRTGDYILLNPYTKDMKGDPVRGGDELVVKELDEKKKRVVLNKPWNFWRNSYSPAVGEKCLIDVRPVNRFPLYSWPAWASGYLGTGKTPGPLIRKILSGSYVVSETDGLFPEPPPLLLKGQKRAFARALKNRLSLIQGPPGTGKTFLISQITEALVNMGCRVFICAFSHRAINNALNACVRNTSLNRVAKIGGGYANEDLDERVEHEPGFPVVGMTAFEAFKPVSGMIKRLLKKGEHKAPTAPKIRDAGYWRKLDAYTKSIFEAGVADREPAYDVAIFDEASQLLIHHALMAMPRAGRYIFVGDHQQMPPVIQGFHKGNPVNRSVFSYLIRQYPELNNILDETRRMNQAITAFPSAEYYDGRLKPIKEVRDRTLKIRALPDDPTLKTIVDPENPVVFVHVDHEGYSQESPEEASVVAGIVFELVSRCGIDPKDGLCVVAAHRRQNNLIREYIARMVKKKRIDEATIQKLVSPDLVIDTVERIQGQERDVVVVSLTASDEEHIKAEKDFLMMPNRMNVSFTRARTKLIVVGSKKLFRMIPADRDKQYEEVVDGRRVFRSKGVVLANHFKRWYFHAKEAQRVVEATSLVGKPL